MRRLLFKGAMRQDWNFVLEMYRKDPSAHRAKITRAEDTVLHIAVSGGRTDIAKSLFNILQEEDKSRAGYMKDILSLQNEAGNTALHLAAELGMTEVCTLMATKCPSLAVEVRNEQGETPLFLTARYGKKFTFFALQHLVIDKSREEGTDYGTSYYRRNDGSTILHCTISGEYFDLAIEIIYLYPQLVNSINARGESPLHLLAYKPSVFRSGSRLGLLDSLIYYCTFVNLLEAKYEKHKGRPNSDVPIDPKEKFNMLPPNYKTISDSIHFLKKMIVPSDGHSIKKCYIADEEDQRSHGMQAQNGSSEIQQHPENYETCINIFKVGLKILLVILGIGLWRAERIAKKKQKNTYAIQIMNELVERSSDWEFDGKKPTEQSREISQIIDFAELPPPEVDGPTLALSADQGKEQSRSTKLQSESSSILVATKGDAKAMMENILDNFSMKVQDISKSKVVVLGMDDTASSNEPEGVTTFLVAAKKGITEMVEEILKKFPVAVQDVDQNGKNIVLVAVEHRQPHIYKLILKKNILKETILGKVDKAGNSALHLAATLSHSRPWIIPGAALQMHWEIKWFKYVKKSAEEHDYFPQYNNSGLTAREVFSKSHDKLVKDGGTWLTNTSQSCSVVAALIATVAFASATTVPGGVNQNSGFPTFEGQPIFQMFAISSLIALCFSVTSLIMFLSILTSRYQEWDFDYDLPVKLILGLTSLFASIVAMLVAFCAGHFFVIEQKLKYAAYPIYAVMCLPITFFAVAQFPLYVDIVKATFASVPERIEKIRDY